MMLIGFVQIHFHRTTLCFLHKLELFQSLPCAFRYPTTLIPHWQRLLPTNRPPLDPKGSWHGSVDSVHSSSRPQRPPVLTSVNKSQPRTLSTVPLTPFSRLQKKRQSCKWPCLAVIGWLSFQILLPHFKSYSYRVGRHEVSEAAQACGHDDGAFQEQVWKVITNAMIMVSNM